MRLFNQQKITIKGRFIINSHNKIKCCVDLYLDNDEDFFAEIESGYFETFEEAEIEARNLVKTLIDGTGATVFTDNKTKLTLKSEDIEALTITK